MQTLSGLRLWVTRPRQQAADLIALLQAAGAEVLPLPLLEIAPPDDPAPLQAALAQIEQFDLAVFISPSALDAIFAHLPAPWPKNLPVAVVGPGSERRASALGVQDIICPAVQFDSEGLLQETRMQFLAGKKLVIFRGNGGRELLPKALQERGALLTIITAYQRQPPRFDPEHLNAQLSSGCDGIVISSSEAAQHLFQLAGGKALQALQSRIYFVPHPRIAQTLIALGAKQIELTNAGDSGILHGICQHFTKPRQESK
ncbi:uroporphyrinogen-III synthase [Iodobacter sp. HSC-16F04]|uniref:Uroporphyrinogen-III synthase n=1 Tax=Iodobacter violaceini TaxID=3044271 RepID=A0ABX0KRD1_9NEIS|nr:uroporphyrinogen-III synthase [Iodobacter violacea]NHQ87176.1 uroporphyrinogen-III synthase [Iodobacter violacea]